MIKNASEYLFNKKKEILQKFYYIIFFNLIQDFLIKYPEFCKKENFIKLFMPYLESYLIQHDLNIHIDFLRLYMDVLSALLLSSQQQKVQSSNVIEYARYIININKIIQDLIKKNKNYLIYMIFYYLLMNFKNFKKYNIKENEFLVNFVLKLFDMIEYFDEDEKNSLSLALKDLSIKEFQIMLKLQGYLVY
jgi:hypothetical protein